LRCHGQFASTRIKPAADFEIAMTDIDQDRKAEKLLMLSTRVDQNGPTVT